jgi:phytoene/squalene synthetase
VDSETFYQTHLDRVSRSFAFCLAQLEPPFRSWLSLAYLLFRLLDTVEDAPWRDPDDQAHQFAELDAYVRTMPSAVALAAWVARFPTDIPEGERLLALDTERLLADVQALPAVPREALLRCYGDMSAGMRHFSQDGRAGVASLAELNQYCFYVASIIGELVHDLLMAAKPDLTLPADAVRCCHRLGLVLQKVNILKDQRHDEQSGRRFVTDRDALLASLMADLPEAFRCVLLMPDSVLSLRQFCAWSLFLGMATIPYVVRSWHEPIVAKVPRAETEALLERISDSIDDPAALTVLFDGLFAAMPAGMPVAAVLGPLALPARYSGLLTAADLALLGVATAAPDRPQSPALSTTAAEQLRR